MNSNETPPPSKAPSYPPEAQLVLPKSGFYVTEDKLVRAGSEETPIAEFEFSHIRDVRCRRSLDWHVLLFIGLSVVGMWAMAYFEVPPLPWSLLIHIPVALFIFLLFIGGSLETELIVLTKSGRVAFPVTNDEPSDAKAFVFSVKEKLKTHGARH